MTEDSAPVGPDWTLESLRRQQPLALAVSGHEARVLLRALERQVASGAGSHDDLVALSELTDRVEGLLETLDMYEDS